MVDGTAHRRFERLVRRFPAMYRTRRHGGGALAVYWHGEPVVDVWTGYADATGDRPWERDTAAMSFSTTKGPVSTVVHRLVDRGLLSYDEPVASSWPVFAAEDKRHITRACCSATRRGCTASAASCRRRRTCWTAST